MKISKLEEYGLRCILQVARSKKGVPVTIPEVAEKERISLDYSAKLLTILRRLKLIKSIRGMKGGYVLARDPSKISVGEVLRALGGFGLEKGKVCQAFPGMMANCPHRENCGIRSVWMTVARYVSNALDQMSLADCIKKEASVKKLADEKFKQQLRASAL